MAKILFSKSLTSSRLCQQLNRTHVAKKLADRQQQMPQMTGPSPKSNEPPNFFVFSKQNQVFLFRAPHRDFDRFRFRCNHVQEYF